MFVQRGEVSVVNWHINMLTASACSKGLVLVRVVLHIAGHTREDCVSIHESKKSGVAAARTREEKKREKDMERLHVGVFVESLFFFFEWITSPKTVTLLGIAASCIRNPPLPLKFHRKSARTPRATEIALDAWELANTAKELVSTANLLCWR